MRFVLSALLLGVLPLESGAQHIYYTDLGRDFIRRANLDGSSPVDLLTTGVPEVLDLELDAASGHMYWIDLTDEKIRRADLDGRNVVDLIWVPSYSPRTLALDLLHRKVYWTERRFAGSPVIRRANLDGTNFEYVITSGIQWPGDVEVDAAGGKVYWNDVTASTISRSDLDGTNPEVILGGPLWVTGSASMALLPAAGKIYFTDNYSRTIRRANLDGSSPEDLLMLTPLLAGPSRIDIDPRGGKMYWSEGSASVIERANLSGTGLETILGPFDFQVPAAVAIDVGLGCAISAPAAGSTAGGPITIRFTVGSPTPRPVDLRFEYSTDTGTTWALATSDASSPLPNPALGVTAPIAGGAFVWGTLADGVGFTGPAAVVFRVQTIDAGYTSACLERFQVDNFAPCNRVCGDCDLNAIGPDILDSLRAAQIAVGVVTPTSVQRSCCDVDSDGNVDVIDSLLLAQVASGLPVALLCP